MVFRAAILHLPRSWLFPREAGVTHARRSHGVEATPGAGRLLPRASQTLVPPYSSKERLCSQPVWGKRETLPFWASYRSVDLDDHWEDLP